MDVREVLQRARGEAGLDQRRLALAAGTARTTVVAYESGARSPTVRQLTRLLAACGLRARVVLEPLTADLDELLAQARAGGRPAAFEALPRLAASLAAGQVRWALDGVSAVAVHGLAVPHHELAVVVVDDEHTRRWLRRACAKGWDQHGFSTAPTWYEDGERVRQLTRRPVFTIPSPLQLRWVDDALPDDREVLDVDGVQVPVLGLAEVRRSCRPVDELLQRAEQIEAPR